MVTRTVDYSALTSQITGQELAAFRAAKRADPKYSTAAATALFVTLIVVTVIMGAIFGLIALGLFFTMMTALIGGAWLALVGLLLPLLLVGMIGLLIWATVRAGGSGRWESWYRFEKFAAANALTFSPVDADPQYSGSIFQNGYGRKALNHFRSAADRFLDYGNYQFETGSGKSHSTHTWGFLALALDRSLPNMVLDSKANNGLFGGSNLALYDKTQVLSLEGDFDNYFTLYCPAAYERDALYVFTPDLMALLIDNAAPFDVEIVDKWMFVYSASPFDLRQPAVHHRVLSIVATVGAKTLTQTERYADERVGDVTANVVAPPGQRLKRRFPLAALIIVLVVGFGWIVPAIVGIVAAVFTR